MPTPAKIGVIGCGKISEAYFSSMSSFPNLKLVACADINPAASAAAAEKWNITAMSVEEMLESPDIDTVINLTIPQAHKDISTRAFAAGKHVFSEKPMAVTFEEAQEIVNSAQEHGKRFGCAPDTCLGAGVQTARAALDSGKIGHPVAFAAAMHCPGHESWHPAPAFYYKNGGGPLLDMGPYYLHALITLLGPVESVTGMSQISFKERVITSEPKRGEVITVEVPTHVLGILRFASGVTGSLSMSFDTVAESTRPVIEIYGEQGTLFVPDPNRTDGEVKLSLRDQKEPQPLPGTHAYAEGSRGLGVAEMMAAINANRPHRANESLSLHAMEVMEAILKSAQSGQHISLSSTTSRPAPMPADGQF